MSEDPEAEHGVSIDVFTGFLKVLEKAHGRKMAGPGFNDFVPLAAKIEAMYVQAARPGSEEATKKEGGGMSKPDDKRIESAITTLTAPIYHSVPYVTESADELIRALAYYRTEHDRVRAAIVEMHGQPADDKCWQDASKVYAACGLPDPDRRVGSKAEMLKNCERYVNQQCEEGGPWKSYAELESENARLETIVHKALKWWNVERGYDVDGSELPPRMTHKRIEQYEAELAEEWAWVLAETRCGQSSCGWEENS